MDIGINEIICTSKYYINDSEDLCYDAKSINRPANCINPECKCDVKPHYHSKSRNLLKDITSDGEIVYINLTVKRYRCPECKSVFYEQFTFYDRKSFLTNRLKDEIVRRYIAGESCYQIAKEYQIDNKSISNAAKNFFAKHVGTDCKTSKIGIYTQFIQDKESIILLDLDENKIIDVNSLCSINVLFSLIQPDCPYYVLDIEPPTFKQVADKSENMVAIHPDAVIQYATNALYEQITAKNTKKSPNREPIEKYFLKKWNQLNKSGTLLLNTHFKKHPKHYRLYILKEILMDIYNICSSKEEAEVLFNAWLEVFKAFSKDKEKTDCLYHIKEHILNHWVQEYDDTFFSKTRKIFSKVEKKGKRSSFDTIVKRGILTIHYAQEEEPFLTVSKMTDTKEKVQLLYNRYQLDYNTELPIEFSHRLQAHIYLYLKYLKNNV